MQMFDQIETKQYLDSNENSGNSDNVHVPDTFFEKITLGGLTCPRQLASLRHDVEP